MFTLKLNDVSSGEMMTCVTIQPPAAIVKRFLEEVTNHFLAENPPHKIIFAKMPPVDIEMQLVLPAAPEDA